RAQPFHLERPTEPHAHQNRSIRALQVSRRGDRDRTARHAKSHAAVQHELLTRQIVPAEPGPAPIEESESPEILSREEVILRVREQELIPGVFLVFLAA